MTHYGIEAIAAQRIQERHDEAARARLAKVASAGAGHHRASGFHLPTIAIRHRVRTTPAA